VAEAVKVADLCLAVARPSYLDLAAAVLSVQVITRLGRDGLIVLNQCPPARAGAEPPCVLKAFQALRFANLPVVPTAIRARMVYQTAFAHARSVLEMEAEGAASQEIRALFGHVWRQLNGEQPAAAQSANDDLRRAGVRA
jgi:chromosome partitioning protein